MFGIHDKRKKNTNVDKYMFVAECWFQCCCCCCDCCLLHIQIFDCTNCIYIYSNDKRFWGLVFFLLSQCSITLPNTLWPKRKYGILTTSDFSFPNPTSDKRYRTKSVRNSLNYWCNSFYWNVLYEQWQRIKKGFSI